jgi:hypothetical protein
MNAFAAAVANPVAAGLIGAALYCATYLAFVRLVRFPRNWLPYRPSEVAVAGSLAALTIAWAAFSPASSDLFNLTTMAVATAFLAMALLIIAAPSIAFRPANAVVELLAKNAEHAGLWLLGPALIAGLMLPDIKLQAILAAAMVLEISWALRQYWRRQPRQLYALTSSDRSVLTAQAKGNLKAFQTRHSIRELELSGDEVAWRGCGKNTPPCPFNFYVNRLGLNTAPCCREHMRDISHYVAACMTEIGAVYWLEGGSLLGAIREDGQLLEWEDDIDISVLVDGDMTWDRLATGLRECGARDGYYVDTYEHEGFVTVSFDRPGSWPFRWDRNRFRGEVRVDIAIYRHATSHGEAVLERRSHKGDMPTTESGGYGVPCELVLPTSTISFVGAEISCPNKSDTYLRMIYGDFETVEYTYVDAAAVQNRSQIEL